MDLDASQKVTMYGEFSLFFNQNRNTNFLLTSNFDYSANSNPNHLIFDSVDSQLSYLS